MEYQVDNAVSIPYHDGLSVGNTVDFTKHLTRGRKVVDGDMPTTSKIDTISCKFCLAENFTDVCEVLDIPPEYALKVESGLVHNDVIKTCLDDIKNKQAFKLIFRLRFIRELQQMSLTPDGDSLYFSIPETDNGVDDPEAARNVTHVVEALYIGDELVIIMKISASEFDALDTFYKKIEQMLGGRKGYIGKDAMLNTFENLGASLDGKLSKSHYKNVSCVIQYGSFHDLDKYPASVSGMAEVIKELTNKWTDATNVSHNPDVTAMIIGTGADEENQMSEPSVVTVMSSQTVEVFNLRVTLQPAYRNDKPLPDDYSQIYEAIFSYIYALKKTEVLIQAFLRNHNLFSNKDYALEGEEISIRVLQRKNQMIEAVERFTMVDTITFQDKERIQEMVAELPDIVDSFIKKVTTKLPTGGDLNLLIIGKTGHGKSSTANTILRRKEFITSSGGISETKSCQRGWSEVDDRTFKIVDIPGVCDTDLDSVDSVRLAMRCISEAISACSEGFHALLLVIRYGNRMTEEEERAIYILKCILGQAIVHSHCICVVTHGDNFDEESEGRFEDWCKRQDGFLKEVFEECNYRCVLFNNKTSNPDVLKTQLIELVSKVDSLEDRGSCYTSDLFKHAEKDRERLVEELQLPQFKEEFLRDLNLLQEDFEDVEKADENDRKAMLDKLKNRAEGLRLKLDEVQCGGVSDIYQAVSNFSERLHRQEEKDMADLQLRLERERFQQKEAQLKAEREAMERQVAEQTEKRVREAAMAAEQRERELREMERKNHEEQIRHAKELEDTKRDMERSYKKKHRWVRFRDSLFKW